MTVRNFLIFFTHCHSFCFWIWIAFILHATTCLCAFIRLFCAFSSVKKHAVCAFMIIRAWRVLVSVRGVNVQWMKPGYTIHTHVMSNYRSSVITTSA